MAIQGPIPIGFDQVFPHGCYLVGDVQQVKDFDASTAGLHALLSGHPVYLDGADEDTTTLADLLITEGLCEPLTEMSSSGYTGLVTPVTYSKQPPTSA